MRIVGACSILAILVVSAFTTAARGAVIVYHTSAGSTTGGQPVNAAVTFTTSDDHITIKLQNLQIDPKSVVQNLSGLQFDLDSGQHSATLASSSGMERMIHTDDSYTDGGVVDTGWELSTTHSGFKLTMLGTHEAPDHTIVGPPNASNIYGNSNGSINKGVHSPFLGLSATFTMDIPDVDADTKVDGVTFMFNTSPGNTVSGTLTSGEVPEPISTSSAVGAAAASLLFGLGRARRTSSTELKVHKP